MPTTAIKAEWIALLTQQLQQAIEREQLWRRLGAQLPSTSQETWKAIADLRHEEVEQLAALLQQAEEKSL